MVFKDLQKDSKFSWLGQVLHTSETVQTSDDTGERWKIQAPPRAFQLTFNPEQGEQNWTEHQSH